MKFLSDERVFRRSMVLFGLLSILLSLSHLVTDLFLPGVEPLAAALFWASFWRWNVLKKTHPGGIWSFAYLLIVILNVTAGISQIRNAIS